MYAILDIETTGLSPKREKITEIAIYFHDGNKITDEFQSLINPERAIPANITQLTGITNAMVEGAPCFYELAKKIIELTENKIIVGHNVNFDYSFIKAEYASLGYEFNRKKLCTVKLSKKLIPGHKSYSLGNICFELGISNSSRHRAAGDAFATVKLFEYLLEKDGNNGASFSEVSALPFKDLHPGLQKESIEKLPAKTGLYYFFNDKGDLVYIGKSKNIFKRVLQHLRDAKSEKANRMRQEIADIFYEETGSELVALLKEDAEIKQKKPVFNRAQRRSSFNTGIYFYYDQNNYIRFKIAKTKIKDIPLDTFNSHRNARAHLEMLVEKHQLCQKLTGLYDGNGACFQYSIKLCHGACCRKETPETYNERAVQAIESFDMKNKDFIVMDKGRNESEKSVVVVENGKYLGYGFLDMDLFDGDIQQIFDSIKPQEDNRDTRKIIKSFIQKDKKHELIRY